MIPSLSIFTLFGIAAGVLSFVAFPIYVLDIIKGTTKPSKVTWWILSFLNALLAASYYASGARDTIWIPISYTIGFGIIAILSIKYGEGSWTKLDFVFLLGAIASGILWLFLSPEVALFAIILVDFFGLAPTILKAYTKPETESRRAWVVAVAASLLNVLAIGMWDPVIASYPIYVFVTNAVIVLFLFRKVTT